MEQRISLITLAVTDLARARAFYERLGWRGQEVDAVLAAAQAAGGAVTRPAQETFYGGYAGYFADPDGHLWEVGYNPGFSLAPDGSLMLPDFGSG